MYHSRTGSPLPPAEAIVPELAELLEQVRALPPLYRESLMPAVAEAIDQARYRGRALEVATEALRSLRVDLELTRFDRDLTRLERQALEARLGT